MTIKFILKSRLLKNNLKSLKLRIVHGSKGLKRDVICDTGLKVNPKYWDKDSERVTDRHSDNQILNDAINEIAYKRNKILTKFQANQLTFEGVVNSLKRGGDDRTLEAFVENQIKELKSDVSYLDYRNKLKGFKKLIGHTDVLRFNDISNEMFVKAHRKGIELQRENKISARTFKEYVAKVLSILKLAKFLGVYDSNFEIPRQYKTLKNKRKRTKNKGNTTADVINAINDINSLEQWQSVAIWVLKFCLRGFYSADIVNMSSTDIENIEAHKMGHLLSTYLKDEVYINFHRSKTEIPMFIHIHNYPTLSLLTRLKATFVYTHIDRQINGKSVLADINDPIKIFDYDLQKNYKSHRGMHKLINKKSSNLGLKQKFARKTFNQYAERLEISEEVRKILIGQITDNLLANSYNDHTLQSKLDKVEKAHKDILEAFQVDMLYKKLLVKLKGIIMRDKLPNWLLVSGGVNIKGSSVKVMVGNPQQKIEWANVEGKYKRYFKKYKDTLEIDDLFEDNTKARVMKAIADIHKQEKEIKEAETKVFKLQKQA